MSNYLPLIDKYTRSLYNILYIDNIDIWENITFNLPSIVDITQLKTLFVNTYKYHEIGFETIARWLDELNDKIFDLSIKYTPLFNVFNTEFTNDQIYNNFIGTTENEQKFYQTPQSQISNNMNDYLTNQTNTNDSENRLVGLTMAEAREIYADKLRYLYHEFVAECRNLFMEIF